MQVWHGKIYYRRRGGLCSIKMYRESNSVDRNEVAIIYRVVHKKGNPLLAAILKYFLEVIIVSVYIFGKFGLFHVSGEEIMGKDAIISLLRLFGHIC